MLSYITFNITLRITSYIKLIILFSQFNYFPQFPVVTQLAKYVCLRSCYILQPILVTYDDGSDNKVVIVRLFNNFPLDTPTITKKCSCYHAVVVRNILC